MSTPFTAVALTAASSFILMNTVALAAGTIRSAAPQVSELPAPAQTDIKPFEQAKMSLVQAVSEVQEQLGGEPLEARFELWHGQLTYLVRTYMSATKGISQQRLDANTGDAIGQPTSFSQDQLSPQLTKEVRALENAGLDLTQAVTSAERKNNAKAMMARAYARRDGSVAYGIDLVGNGRLRLAAVDAKTGQLR